MIAPYIRNPFVPSTPLPAGKRFMLQQTSGEQCRALVQAHIDQCYWQIDGAAVPWFVFLRRFIRSLADPHLEQWFSDKKRVRRVLNDLGFVVAPWQKKGDATMMVANICALDRGSLIAPRRLILEPVEHGCFLSFEDIQLTPL